MGYPWSEALKVEMTHVPYRSTSQQIPAMMAGVAPLGFVQIGPANPHIKAGIVKATRFAADN